MNAPYTRARKPGTGTIARLPPGKVTLEILPAPPEVTDDDVARVVQMSRDALAKLKPRETKKRKAR